MPDEIAEALASLDWQQAKVVIKYIQMLECLKGLEEED